MPNAGVVKNVLAGPAPDCEACPNCGGQWFTPVYRLKYVPTGGIDGRYLLDQSDEGDADGEWSHQAEEGFGCMACGAVITQDRLGRDFSVDAPRVGRLAKVQA